MMVSSLIPKGRRREVLRAGKTRDSTKFKGRDPEQEGMIPKKPVDKTFPEKNKSQTKKVLPTLGNLQRLKDEMIVAVEKGDYERVKELIDAGCPVEIRCKNQNEDKFNILAIAIEGGFVEIVSVFIKHGSDLKFKRTCPKDPKKDGNALAIAIGKGNPKIVELILEELERKSIDIDLYLSNALLIAAGEKEPNLEIIKKLIAAGADVNQINEEGWTSLHIIVNNHCSDELPFVRVFINAGMDLNKLITQGEHRGKTILDLVKYWRGFSSKPSARERRDQIIKVLKKAGAR